MCICVCVGFINLQCLLRVVIQQNIAPLSLVLADVIKMKLHSWKHLLHLLTEARKKKEQMRLNRSNNTATEKIRRQIEMYSWKRLSGKCYKEIRVFHCRILPSGEQM